MWGSAMFTTVRRVRPSAGLLRSGRARDRDGCGHGRRRPSPGGTARSAVAEESVIEMVLRSCSAGGFSCGGSWSSLLTRCDVRLYAGCLPQGLRWLVLTSRYDDLVDHLGDERRPGDGTRREGAVDRDGRWPRPHRMGVNRGWGRPDGGRSSITAITDQHSFYGLALLATLRTTYSTYT